MVDDFAGNSISDLKDGLEISVFPWGKADWQRLYSSVINVDQGTKRIIFDSQNEDDVPYGEGCRYFLQNRMEFLDQPGEFYFNVSEKKLYLHSYTSGTPVNVTIPHLTRLFELKGASNITIENLILTETASTFPVKQWEDGNLDESLIYILDSDHLGTNPSKNITIRECHLKNSGRHGVMFFGNCTQNRVEGCLLENMANNGISFFSENQARQCTYNTVIDCMLRNIGELYTYSHGVGLWKSSYNTVTHIEVHNSVRYAVTLKGPYSPKQQTCIDENEGIWSKNNTVTHSKFINCGQDGGDMGALHTRGVSRKDCPYTVSNSFDQIIISGVKNHPSSLDELPNGIFLDYPGNSSNQIFKNIFVGSSEGEKFRGNGNPLENQNEVCNVNFSGSFDPLLIEWSKIGVTSNSKYGDGCLDGCTESTVVSNIISNDESYRGCNLIIDGFEITNSATAKFAACEKIIIKSMSVRNYSKVILKAKDHVISNQNFIIEEGSSLIYEY